MNVDTAFGLTPAAARRPAAALPTLAVGLATQLGGGAASRHYQTYHVGLLRRLAATRPEPIWRRTYLRWRRCLPGHGS